MLHNDQSHDALLKRSQDNIFSRIHRKIWNDSENRRTNWWNRWCVQKMKKIRNKIHWLIWNVQFCRFIYHDRSANPAIVLSEIFFLQKGGDNAKMKGTFKAPFIFFMLRVDDINRKQVFTFNTFVYLSIIRIHSKLLCHILFIDTKIG